MNQLMKFEDNVVIIIQDKFNNPLFELYSTGMALGYIKYAKNKPYPKKDRIDITVSNAEIKPVVHNGQPYLDENQLYDFMLEARTDKCRKFRKWITSEVLPSIRKTGTYSVCYNNPYTYINKTYKGRPILTANDIENLYAIPAATLYNHIKTRLEPNRDYKLLQGDELKEYNNENYTLPRCRRSLFAIFNTGLARIISHYGLDENKAPLFMVERKGYIVDGDVRQLMEFVRRELKGVEALTYLIESDDTPSNLENYRKILIKKLSSIRWWKSDVEFIKLGIHQISLPELEDIHSGTYGIRY